MKKILLTVFSFLILSSFALATTYTVTLLGVTLANPIVPKTWYATAAGAGLKTGTSQGNAWAGIQWGQVNIGDTIYMCGTFNTAQTIGVSGVSGYTITVRGDCPSNAGILDGAKVVTTWTSVSSNVYSTPGPFTLSPNLYGIVTEDDVALIAVPWNTNITTTAATMVSNTATYSLGTWTYDPVGQLLYVLTTDATSPGGHTMEVSYGGQYTNLIYGAHSYVTIENLTIKNAGDYGIDLYSGTNNTVTGNTLYDISNWSVIGSYMTNLIVSNNTIHNVVWQAHAPDTSYYGEAIRFYSSSGSAFGNAITYSPSAGIDLYHTSGVVNVYNNTIHDNIGMNSNYSAGIYLDEGNNNNVYDNLIYNWDTGISLNDENGGAPSTSNKVYNNLNYNWYHTGIYLGGTNSYIASKNNLVYNNTFVVGPSAKGGGASQALAVQGSSGDTFKNNIVYGAVYTDGYHWSLTPGNFDYNQYLNSTFAGAETSFAAWQTANGGDTHSGNTSPSLASIFTSAAGLNFELVAASSPIGAGLNLYSVFTTDYDGGARQSNGAWDVGAYAYP